MTPDRDVSFNDLVISRVKKEITSTLIVPWVMDSIAAQYVDEPIWFRWFRPPALTWEERLAAAIEERSIRNRLRRWPARLGALRRDWTLRLHYASCALRGDWPDIDSY